MVLHLVGYTDEKALYCPSRDRVTSFERGTVYCSIIGTVSLQGLYVEEQEKKICLQFQSLDQRNHTTVVYIEIENVQSDIVVVYVYMSMQALPLPLSPPLS